MITVQDAPTRSVIACLLRKQQLSPTAEREASERTLVIEGL